MNRRAFVQQASVVAVGALLVPSLPVAESGVDYGRGIEAAIESQRAINTLRSFWMAAESKGEFVHTKLKSLGAKRIT